MSVIADFAELFAGRTDAYGTEDGGCNRVGGNLPKLAWGVCNGIWDRHLKGEEPIGVYPIVQYAADPEWKHEVKWGCVDFDIAAPNHPTYDYETEAEAHDAAIILTRVLRRLGITGWIERTRSHGRHVWVFASGWMPARDMRRTLLVACDVAEVPTREVNPKQEQLSEGQLGNYVRLPYPGGAVNERLVADEHMTVLTAERFVREALQSRSAPSVFAEAAALWKPPPPPKLRIIGDSTSFNGGSAFPTYIAKMIKEGPLEGTDRSTFLARLAHKCAGAGMSYDLAFEALLLADEVVGKFVDRNDREKRLLDMVDRAYT